MEMLFTLSSCRKDARLRPSASALPSATLQFSSQLSLNNGFIHLKGQIFYNIRDSRKNSVIPGYLLNSLPMNWQNFTLGSIVTSWILAIVTVCLRFSARRISKAGLWYDDWLIVPATVRAPYAIHYRKLLVSQGGYIELTCMVVLHHYNVTLRHCYE